MTIRNEVIDASEFRGSLGRPPKGPRASSSTPADVETESAPGPGRRIAGARAQSSGRAFEHDLDITHDYYRLQGWADVIRLPVPTVPAPKRSLGDGQRFGQMRILAERQRADYAGSIVLRTPGRVRGRVLPFVMEAKATSQEEKSLAISLPERKGGYGLKLHQLESIVRGWRDFGVPGIVIWRNGDQRLMFMPWVLDEIFHQVRLGNARKITADRAVRFGSEFVPRAGHIENYLPTLLECLQDHGALAALPPGDVK